MLRAVLLLGRDGGGDRAREEEEMYVGDCGSGCSLGSGLYSYSCLLRFVLGEEEEASLREAFLLNVGGLERLMGTPSTSSVL